ncbi:hypothetical protein JYU34_007569 [Plutella xylostella]|uniref:Acyl-coenzyme A oxidase n=1 Tax=Plutella xylostella TaxID=51655 RepID=A0ABQ7QQS9_PLUXY|nr:hypothetical protein JYU34_007569 [Plutella xylostella]
MADLSFIPDLPSGPLDCYRSTASFDWKQLKLSLEGDLDLLKLKYKIWKTLEKDLLFAPPSVTPSVEEQKRITQLQLKKINNYKFMTYEMFKSSYSKRTRAIMTINEAVQSVNPSVSVKMAIGIYLFSNALLSLGTERHYKFFEATIWNREILASFALTEVAHGSDARLMCTTASYDPKSREFVVHTPDFKAAKCWVGNLGRTCTHTLLFAQLITPDGTNHGLHGFVVPVRDPATLETYPGLVVGDMGEKIDGTNQGLHGFVVPVRDPATLETYPGLVVGDMGEKIGVNGIDNGRQLCGRSLARWLITPDGTNHGLHGFVVPVRDPATLETYPGLVVGDMGEKIGVNGIDNGFIMFNQYRIPRENLLNRTADVTEDGVYESSFSEPSKMLGAALENLSAGRIGIMQESCHTISSAVAIAIRYAATRRQFGAKDDEIPLLEYELHSAAVSEIHAMVSCSKPLLTWTTLDAVQQCREACGGHGYLKCANLGDLRCNHEPTVTYEGDNNVLSQQAGNWLLRQYEQAAGGVDSPLGTVTFLTRCQDILADKFSCERTEQLKDVKFIISTYQWLLCWLLKETHQQYESEVSKGQSKFEAKSKCQVYRWKTLSRVYAEYLAIIFCSESVSQEDTGLRPVLNKLLVMYGLWSLDQHLVELYQGGFASGDSLALLLRAAILEMCAQLKPEVVSVVDALAPTDFVLNSVLGKSDGNLYQNLQKALFGGAGTMERASWWREVVNSAPSKL